MPKNHTERHILVRVTLHLNAQETLIVDELLDSGLYGVSRAQAVRRLMDERLVEMLQAKGRRIGNKK